MEILDRRRTVDAPTLAGASMRVRPWRPDDAGALRDACGDYDICSFTTVPKHYSQDAAEDWIARQTDRLVDGSGLVLAIEPFTAEHPVGAVWLFEFEEDAHVCALGVWLTAGTRGRGYGTQAAGMLCHWAFAALRLRSVWFHFEPENLAVRRIAERLGAVPAGPFERLGDTRDLYSYVLHALAPEAR